MKTQQLALLLGTAALALSGCSTVSVQTDYDRATSFAQYHTYVLTAAAKGQTLAPTGDAALRDALRTNLGERGIQEVAGPAADLEVVQQVFTSEKVSVQQYSDWGYSAGYSGRWPGRYGSYGMWTGAPMTYTDVQQYTTGTLVLDFVDTKTQKLVFRGVGTGDAGTPNANADSIRTAVKKMFRDFPKVAAP